MCRVELNTFWLISKQIKEKKLVLYHNEHLSLSYLIINHYLICIRVLIMNFPLLPNLSYLNRFLELFTRHNACHARLTFFIHQVVCPFSTWMEVCSV